MNGAPLGGHCHKIIGELPQAFFLAVPRQADAVTHRLFLQRGMVLHQHHHAIHCMGRSRHIRLCAGKAKLRTAADSCDPKLLFQQMDILVTVPKNCGGQFDAVQFHGAFCQNYPSCSLHIILTH